MIFGLVQMKHGGLVSTGRAGADVRVGSEEGPAPTIVRQTGHDLPVARREVRGGAAVADGPAGARRVAVVEVVFEDLLGVAAGVAQRRRVLGQKRLEVAERGRRPELDRERGLGDLRAIGSRDDLARGGAGREVGQVRADQVGAGLIEGIRVLGEVGGRPLVDGSWPGSRCEPLSSGRCR